MGFQGHKKRERCRRGEGEVIGSGFDFQVQFEIYYKEGCQGRDLGEGLWFDVELWRHQG